MFSDSDTCSLGFSSNWKFSRENEDSSVQTAPVTTNDKNVQTKDAHSTETQTDDDVQNEAVVYNEDRLATFLSNICPAVVEELDRVSRSNAFTLNSLTADQEEEDVQEILSLSLPSHKGLKVSSLSWGCNGSILAVAVSHTLHPSWCSHQSVLALYNVDRDNKSASRKLETTACVRSVSLHPFLSSIVAAGLFSGEVVVWDTSREGSEASLVNSPHTAHEDSVTKIGWALGAGTSVVLVSSSLDGHLFFWKVSPKLSSYQIVEKYSCELSGSSAGVTCFAFPYHKQDTFVVALEGGQLLHCSTTAAKPIHSGSSRHSVKDPVVSRFESQPATVVSVEFSPHHDDVFATAATDQAIRIYSLFQNCLQSVLWSAGSVMGLSWSPVQACVLLSWGDSGCVTVHNSSTGTTLYTLTPTDTDRKIHLSTVAFNAKSPRLLAVGDLDGNTHVWKVPLHITTNPKHSTN